MAFIDCEGIRLHYRLTGETGLPVVLFSNSLGADLSMWDLQLEAMAADFRILRYDTRGHGQSSAPPGPYTIAGLGREVLRLLDALEIERASFCGISMGGLIGQWLGIHAAHRLDKLVLANTAAKIGVAEVWSARIALVLREGLEPAIAGTLERWFTPGFHEANPAIIEATAAMLRSANAPAYAACCAAIRDADFRATVGSVSVPTLAIAGSFDPVTYPADGRYLADAIPGASYVELPAAHLSSREAAATFNEALLGFLRA